MPKSPGRPCYGFTLVELLVVIATISLLISLLLPALASARRRAQETACLTGVRQFGQAAMMYALDNKQSCVPQVRDANNFNYIPLVSENAVMGTYRWAYWADALLPYLSGNRKVYECPLGSIRGLSAERVPWGYATTPFIYPVNGSGGRTSGKPLTIDQFRNPTSKLYFMDSGFSNIGGSGNVPRQEWTPYLATDYGSSSGNRATPAIRHNMSRMPSLALLERPSGNVGYNAAFFDGHASFVQWNTSVPQYFSGGAATAADIAMRNRYWLP